MSSPSTTTEGADASDDRKQQLLDPTSQRSTACHTGVSSPPSLISLGFLRRYTSSLYHNPPPFLGLAVLFINQCLFALMHVVAKPALQFIPPMSLAMMRVSLALPFLFFLAWSEGSLGKFDRRDARSLLLLGLIGVAMPQTLVFVANKIAGPNIVAIMSPTVPVYAAILASALKLERVTPFKIGGILLAVSGALVVLRPDKMDLTAGHPSETAHGVLVMLLQTLCYAGYLVALKIKLQTHAYPFGIYAYASLIGLSLIVVVGLSTGLVQFDFTRVPRNAWCAVLYCGLVISFWAHACQTWAVAHTSASLPALFSCLSPFLTGFLAFVILGERVGSMSDIIGLLLNLGGLMSVIYSKMRLEKPIPVVGMTNHVVHGDGVDGINSSPDTYLTEAEEPERKESHDVTKPMVPNGIFLRPGTPSAF